MFLKIAGCCVLLICGLLLMFTTEENTAHVRGKEIVQPRSVPKAPYRVPNISKELAKTVQACGDLVEAMAGVGREGNLLLAIITVESGCMPQSLGKNGELGLMQLKPIAAETVRCKSEFLLDASYNLACGIKYLAYLTQNEGITHLDDILVAYNRGPTAFRNGEMATAYVEKVKSAYTILEKAGNI